MGEAKLALAVSEEDVLRANLYRLLAGTLRVSPSRRDLDVFADMHGDDTPIGQSVSAITRVAANTSPEEIAREYHDLFIGVGRGELLPLRFLLPDRIPARKTAGAVAQRHEPSWHSTSR